MKYTKILVILFAISTSLYAGNEQRIGQAGSTESYVNAWGRSSGLASSSVASVTGIEAMYQNIAGAAFTKKTELAFVHTRWLSGSGIGINNFGLAQKIGETNALTLGVTSFSFGDIERTTVDNPEGGNGTFNINYTTISAGFAKEFSNSIYGGFNIKIISEGISDVKATGIALDAGIIYRTGLGKNKLGKKNRDNFKFGITLKNVGPTMKYTGDGISFKGQSNDDVPMSLQYRSQDFEMPTQLMLGLAYDFRLTSAIDTVTNKIVSDHMLTVSAAFISNSFTKDQASLGVEYSFRNLFQLRAGYLYEEEITSEEFREIVYTGPSVGATIKVPINKEEGSYIGIDYSYRATVNFNGIHTIGARIIL
ncbi:MAG: PorV/PorQ family protein [Bacteroidales bacterium]|nr:PorV/PorQ family protein [Bacteroidales bacterium]